jgi:hypothetical protein
MKFPWDDEPKPEKNNPNTPAEAKFLHEIIANQENAESVRGTDYDDADNTIIRSGIEQVWEDEYKILIGDQWDTSFAYRSKEAKKRRPNSTNNFVFPAVMNIVDNITINTPDVIIEGREDDDKEVADKLTYISRYNDSIHRNNFKRIWKKMVLQFIAYGPVIGGVLWDNDWLGGTGPNRWVGDVRLINIDRRHIFFDPAVIELEERLQECAFIHRKYRKKISWIKEKWPEKGQHVSEEVNEMELQDEGMDPKQVWLIEAWNRGRPKFISEERKKEFLAKAQEAESIGDYYKAQDYKDMAAGKLIGVHCAYVANNVFLEYIPYVYEDGLYPFVYKTLYYDENTQYGFGEIKNIKLPQVMHNKPDEIEIEAMSREGIGGMYYGKGGINARQKEEILKNNGKGGVWLEVDDINKLKEREGAKVPQSVRDYKEHKQRMIETISQNTPIQQGMSPGANVPYRAIAELGARTDVRTKAKVEILQDFLIELNKLRINRFIQFYTEDRYYRLKGDDGQIIEGTFNNQMMFRQWEREDGKQETFTPEFDIDVKIMDEKPQDRSYYTNTAFELLGVGGMTIEHLWYTLDEGKFPPKEQILEDLKTQNMVMQLMEKMKSMPPEQQEQMMSMTEEDQFLKSLPDEVLQVMQNMPDADEHLEMMRQMEPDELQAHVQEMLGGEQSETQTQNAY